MFEKLFTVAGLVFFAWLYFWICSKVVQWAVSLFYVISFKQALAIVILANLFGSVTRIRK